MRFRRDRPLAYPRAMVLRPRAAVDETAAGWHIAAPSGYKETNRRIVRPTDFGRLVAVRHLAGRALMTDYAMQRLNMVESQLRPSDITDRRILRAMAEIKRESYLPAHLRMLAYMDDDIRLASSGKIASRTMMAPRVLALLIQLARIEPGERVLEIGCGSGYATAVLARLAGQVIALESDAELARSAVAALAADAVANVRVVTGDLSQGFVAEAPYDAILLNGALVEPPAALLDQLRDGGRLVAVEMRDGFGRATAWMRHGMNFDRRTAFDARSAVLPGFEVHSAFSL